MKKIKFTCSNCEAKLRVPTHLAGISAPCPKCGRKITAPTDLDCIVDDEPVAKPRAQAPAQQARQTVAPSSPSGQTATATAVADAPPRPQSAPRVAAPQPVAPAPVAEVPAPAPPVTETPVEGRPEPIAPPVVTAPVVTQEAPVLPVAPTTPTVQAPPVVEEQEPIIEETLLTPPLEKTQPIQVSPSAGILPQPVASEGSLPRLDAERGSESTLNSFESFIATSGVAGAPTRLQLPQPGEVAEQQSPSDFIVPTPVPLAAPTHEAAPVETISYEDPEHLPVPSEPVIPDLADLDIAEGGISMDELGEDPEPLAEFEPEAFGTPDSEALAEAPIIAEQSVAVPEPEALHEEAYLPREVEVPVEQPIQAAAPELETHTELDFVIPEPEETPEAPLSGGSFETLLAQQSQPQQPAYEEPPLEDFVPDQADDLASMFDAAPREEVAPLPAPAEENQSFDELFGIDDAEPGKKKKLTTVVMLSMIGGVAIISIIIVLVVVNALGGFKPQFQIEEAGVTPPPPMREIPASTLSSSSAQSPSISDAPAVIDPIAQSPVSENVEGISRSTTTLPGDTSRPVLISDGAAPAKIDPPAATQPTAADAPALSFDERVQQIVNGTGGGQSSPSQMNIIGGENKPSPLDSLDDTIAGLNSTVGSAVEEVSSAAAGVVSGAAAAASGEASTSSNYNPPASFPAPSPGDPPLGKTHDLLDAFLRAPDWQSRVPYIYQGESLRPAIEDYYKKWTIAPIDRFALQLFQVEEDTALGGPYWVYLVSTSDTDQGYPVIVRSENGNLKVDWEIYSEFQDRHFVQFQNGAIASPHTFRLVIERVSDYYGSDRDGFTNLADYNVFQINPPYGDLSEHSEYAFVKKDSALAAELDSVVGLNDEPLAVIVTVEQKAFPHGVKHLEITDYVTEGWFR